MLLRLAPLLLLLLPAATAGDLHRSQRLLKLRQLIHAGGAGRQAAPQAESGARLQPGRSAVARSAQLLRLERRRLDIVMVHYDWERLQAMRSAWQAFLAQDKVAALQPSVFVYCHNYDPAKAEELEPLFTWGGGVVPVENAGREGGGYLEHILRHWDALADHTLFSQDAPAPTLQGRFLRMFREDTGYLPLAAYGGVACDYNYLPTELIQQMYAMLTRKLCPPEGWVAGFNGEFVVSRARILANPRSTYEYVLGLLAAPSDHWLHDTHEHKAFKDRSNPMFGHVVERAWSLAFDCYDPWHFDGCWQCNDDPSCDLDTCQCLDE